MAVLIALAITAWVVGWIAFCIGYKYGRMEK
jgi:hypothetical protein